MHIIEVTQLLSIQQDYVQVIQLVILLLPTPTIHVNNTTACNALVFFVPYVGINTIKQHQIRLHCYLDMCHLKADVMNKLPKSTFLSTVVSPNETCACFCRSNSF